MKRMRPCIIAIALFAAAAGPASAVEVVYVVGSNSTMLELRSGEWLPVAHGITNASFREIWGSSPANIYVTGIGSSLAYYDGVAWRQIAIYDPTKHLSVLPTFYTIDGCGPNDIWVGGFDWGQVAYTGYAYHFDGSGWIYAGPTPDGVGIRRIWANPGGGFYALGLVYSYPDRVELHRILSYVNDAWSVMTPKIVPSDPGYKYYALGGLGPNVPVVTGSGWDPTFYTTVRFIIQKTSTGWSTIIPCSNYYECPGWPVVFYGICGGTESDVWLAGGSGTVLHWTPTGHTLYSTGVTATLRGIWAASTNDVYAVGDAGTIVHFDGAAWTAMPVPTTQNLADIWGYVEMPIATLLQSQSTDVSASGVTIRWSLSDFDEGTAFRVLRSAGEAAEFVADEDPRIERENLAFTYVDSDVVGGASYTYIVECSGADGWSRLLEAGPLTVPEASFALMTNYPNPFNPATSISYSIREQGNVALKIYDVTGALVATLVDATLAPGEYTAHWNGSNDQGASVASGTYFCRLSSAKQAETRKILLMR